MAQDLYNNTEARLRFEAYSRLQAAAVAFGESLPIPEIVAIGGQSDGKSSLLEAFLGFRFNVREVEMGTRRPLICLMVHDPTAETPRCRLQAEDSEEFGSPIYPKTAVAEAIKEMTEAHLRQTGGTVSAKPIVLRVEFAYAPNLTIIDTPGFILKARQGEGESTPNDILEMVKAQAAPPNRLILFLQQSSVEWCSSLWMHVVQELDPNFQRTIVVASKFDNRLKEFGERWEVDRYLSAAGYLSANVKPFFVALPKERTISKSSEWREQIQAVDRMTLQHMRENIAGGFDEERFGSCIGFGNLKRFLEEELARRYRDAAPATLALLHERSNSLAAELAQSESKLHDMQDTASLRRLAMKQVGATVMSFQEMLLEGVAAPELMQHGLTLEEERAASSAPQWPGVQSTAEVAHAELRLLGGASFERSMADFRAAINRLGFPGVGHASVANVLLSLSLKGASNGDAAAARAAQKVARSSARQLLLPLLDALIARLAAVLLRTWHIAVDHIVPQDDALRPYVAFNAELRAAFQAFVNLLEEQCRGLVRHQLDVATSAYAAKPLSISALTLEDDDDAVDAQNIPPPPTQILHDRDMMAASQMTVPETPSPEVLANNRRARRPLASFQPNLTAKPASNPVNKTYSSVCAMAERHFMAIRQSVAAEEAPAIVKAAFLEPVSRRLATDLSIHLFARTDQHFMNWFASPGAVEVLTVKRDALARRVDGLVRCKNEFAELARCL
ncbi:Dynamin-related protein 5A [Coccomyxa sp. Obi]|nr:Dynamin-related protein 5A [Coccomyxa sp. Obi]